MRGEDVSSRFAGSRLNNGTEARVHQVQRRSVRKRNWTPSGGLDALIRSGEDDRFGDREYGFRAKEKHSGRGFFGSEVVVDLGERKTKAEEKGTKSARISILPSLDELLDTHLGSSSSSPMA